jgi:hypothetical protein
MQLEVYFQPKPKKSYLKNIYHDYFSLGSQCTERCLAVQEFLLGSIPFETKIIGCKRQFAEKTRIYYQPRERKANLTNGR